MNRGLATLAVLSAAIASPLLAVGMGPLSKSGVTDGPAKAFWLTVMNPYDRPQTFVAYATGRDGEAQGLADVDVRPARMRIGSGGQRRILVIAHDLAPGETRDFSICAALEKQEGMIHARVCSQISARRIAPRS